MDSLLFFSFRNGALDITLTRNSPLIVKLNDCYLHNENGQYLDAVAIPRAIGSLKPSLSSTAWTKFAPTRPVSTTTAAVRDEFTPEYHTFKKSFSIFFTLDYQIIHDSSSFQRTRSSMICSLPSNRETMLRASATVMHRGRIDIVKFGSNPISLPMSAVEYSENSVDIMTEVKISAACLLTSWE